MGESQEGEFCFHVCSKSPLWMVEPESVRCSYSQDLEGPLTYQPALKGFGRGALNSLQPELVHLIHSGDAFLWESRGWNQQGA